VNKDKMREEFETRFPVPSGCQWSEEHKNYGWVKKSAFQRVITYRALFTGWQASRAAVVIELPSQQAFGPHPDDWGYPAEETRTAIEAAGVTVRQKETRG